MKKILITGSNGLLGHKIVYALTNKNDVELIAASRGENRLKSKKGYTYQSLDITDKNKVREILLRYRPDTVINTAAMTNVDGCESDKDGCWSANVKAVENFIDTISHNPDKLGNTHFIHLSTDFIFNGEAGPYKETDMPDPLSYYGLSKYVGEKLIRFSNIRWTILRTIIVYGVTDNMSRSNIVLWAKGALEQQKPINVVDDQFRMPTLSEDLAQGCIFAAMKEKTGIFNMCGKDYMSILELVYRVADFFGLDKAIVTSVKSNTLNQPAKRPPRTGFVLDKAMNELGYNPRSFEEGLEVVRQQLEGSWQRQ